MKMASGMKVKSITATNMDRVSSFISMVIFMMDSGTKEKSMAGEPCLMPMEIIILVSGSTGKNQAKEHAIQVVN